MMRRSILAVLVAMAIGSGASVHAWGGQGHRLVGLVAANHLTPVAKQNVEWLLDGQTLAAVSSWADNQRTDHQQTGYWHYLNIPPDASGYDRDRDCPRQPDAPAGTRADRWRDCAVDRITYMEQRVSNRALDRADRATALKFLVHFIGDLHQPFHALGVGRGGNDVIVRVFGSATCGNDPAKPGPCDLHAVWDSRLIAHRGLDDQKTLVLLEILIAQKEWFRHPPGTPAQWAEQSWALGKAALVKPDTNIDEAYYRAQIPVINERLALAGLRLAAVLNRAFVTAPPTR